MRCCRVCGVDKPLSDFPKHRQRPAGRDSRCKACANANGTAWYEKKQVKSDRLYSTWVGMKSRCIDTAHQSYQAYGGRGIKVCDEWLHEFAAFESWAKINGYRNGLQLDRIDNERGYEPNNCRFVTRSENMKNKVKRAVPVRNNAKLSKSDVLEVRRLLAAGQSQRAIASQFGVSHNSIGCVFRGQSWKEVS